MKREIKALFDDIATLKKSIAAYQSNCKHKVKGPYQRVRSPERVEICDECGKYWVVQ
jgi:hypothetical protein